MFTVALTGGIGSGKSTVGAEFEKLGIAVFDADVIAREVVEPGEPALAAIVAEFGPTVLDENGGLARQRLRELVFADPRKREKLEAIVHPRVRDRMRALVDTAPGPYCIVSIPLLFETHQGKRYDRVLVVDVPVETQISRTIRRDGSPRETIEGILAAQIDREERLRLADDILDNSGETTALRSQVTALHEKYLVLAAQSK